ncbi:hypothetical protein D770_16010 [Flammeovirgaceae bacterium 311]|nr:hypothetical protein D770_16010 [Flammeovirgaceae bacterium 311]
MNKIHLQEKHIYNSLNPLFKDKGYELLPFQKQFRLPTRNGYRAALIAVNGTRYEQTIDLHLGIRLDIVEDLVNQFIRDLPVNHKENTTITASYGRLTEQPYKRFLVKDEADISAVCKRIESFMTGKGFKFLESFDRLRKIDGLINRKPEQACYLLNSQIIRCFKGIALAKMTHRTDFNRLVKTYLNYLHKQWAPQAVIDNYKKFVRFLRFYSLN